MQNQNDLTGKLRVLYAVLFSVGVLAALGGWMFFERDPGQLIGVLGFLVTALGIGEASNVGKRATFKADA